MKGKPVTIRFPENIEDLKSQFGESNQKIVDGLIIFFRASKVSDHAQVIEESKRGAKAGNKPIRIPVGGNGHKERPIREVARKQDGSAYMNERLQIKLGIKKGGKSE